MIAGERTSRDTRSCVTTISSSLLVRVGCLQHAASKRNIKSCFLHYSWKLSNIKGNESLNARERALQPQEWGRTCQESPASSLLSVFKLQILLKDELGNQNLEVFWVLLKMRDPVKASSAWGAAVFPAVCDKEHLFSVVPTGVLLLLPLITPFHSQIN